MAEPIGIGNTGNIDISKWRKLTAQEIIKEESKGEEIPAEIMAWAQQMAAFSKIPDNVTYEQVDGDVGLEALEKLGIEDTDTPKPGQAADAEKTEDPDAVKDPAETEESEIADENPEIHPQPENAEAEVAEEAPEDELSLSDTDLTTDPEKIRKRKERKGLA